MSLSDYRLKIQQGNTVYACDLYTTPEEARSVAFADHPRVCVNIGGTTYYCGTAGDDSPDVAREQAPIAVFYDATVPRLYRIAQKAYYSINITTVANQTITVTASDKPLGESGTGEYSFTSGYKVFPYGTTWSASVTASTGWNAGTLTPASSGTLTNANVVVTASAATHKTYKITLTQKANETVTIHYKNHNGTSLASSWSTTTGSVTLGHGSQYYLTIAASTGWNAGSITNAGSASSPITLTGAVTVAFNAATHKTFTLKHTAAGTGQTLVVKYKNYNGSSFSSEATLASGGSVTVGYGTTWTATLTAATGYTKGTLSPSTSGTVTGNVTVSASAATIQKFYLRYGASVEVRYNNASGSKINSGTQINYNQVIWVKNTRNNITSISFKLYKNSSASGTVWTTKTSSPFTFNMPNSQIYIYNESKTGSGDG